MEQKIKLNKDNILRLEIETSDGKSTGEYLEFDLEDITLPLKYQEMMEKNKKNITWLRNQMLILEKKQDVKGKKILTKKQEDMIKILQSFFNRQEEIYNIFLGENGFKKLSNNRTCNWFTIETVNEIIEKQIAPYFNLEIESIEDKIKEKYKDIFKNENVI